MTTGVNLEALGASGVILRLRKSPPPAGPGLPPPPRWAWPAACSPARRRVVLVPSRPPRPAPPGRGPRLPGGAPGWVLTKRHSGKETSLPKPLLPCALPGPDRAGGSEHPDPTTFGVTRRPSGSPPLPGAGTGRPGYLVSPVPLEPPGSRITREPAPGAGGGEGPRGSGHGGSPSPSAGQTTDLLGRSRWDLPMLAGEAGRGPEAGAAVLEIILEAAGSETPRHLSGVPQLP